MHQEGVEPDMVISEVIEDLAQAEGRMRTAKDKMNVPFLADGAVYASILAHIDSALASAGAAIAEAHSTLHESQTVALPGQAILAVCGDKVAGQLATLQGHRFFPPQPLPLQRRKEKVDVLGEEVSHGLRLPDVSEDQFKASRTGGQGQGYEGHRVGLKGV